MNAAELYEIIKDVPRQAWPEKIRHTANLFAYMHEGGDKFMPTSLMEAAFVGSMVLYLIGEGYHDLHWDGDSDEGTVTLTLYYPQFTATSEIACLAAACKGAKA